MGIIRLLITCAICYVILVGILFFLQRRLLYFPDPTQPQQGEVEAAGLSSWPETDTPFRGYLSAPPENTVRGTLIIFHGNAGSAYHRAYYTEHLPQIGYRVLLAEYPGYGGRPGNLNQKEIVADGLETLARIRQQFGDPVYICGESLGAGVAAAVAAAALEPPAGVIAITPWDSLPELAQAIYWYLPVRILIKDTYDNITNLNHYVGPVVVAMAENDDIIPQKHTLTLYEHLDGPKKLLILANAGHNTWPATTGVLWWRDTLDFFENTRISLNQEVTP